MLHRITVRTKVRPLASERQFDCSHKSRYAYSVGSGTALSSLIAFNSFMVTAPSNVSP